LEFRQFTAAPNAESTSPKTYSLNNLKKVQYNANRSYESFMDPVLGFQTNMAIGANAKSLRGFFRCGAYSFKEKK